MGRLLASPLFLSVYFFSHFECAVDLNTWDMAPYGAAQAGHYPSEVASFRLPFRKNAAMMTNKPARNDPCPCGSGRKFKKCHGYFGSFDSRRILDSPAMRQELKTSVARHEAQEFQRREQQGLGKPIISTQFHDHRIVAVGSTIHYSKHWKTFHDFLNDYPKIVLGKEWWMSEVGKPPGERHRILTWAVRSFEQRKVHLEQKGAAGGQPTTGAIAAYMRFAYDLYGLKHAVEVQKLLLDRIKCPNNFPGALYEVRVAAAMLRAGFILQHEDESDRRSTHVEFVATHAAFGATYTVEAKRRQGRRLNINNLVSGALRKHSDHPRIVFIDTNDVRLELGRDQLNPVPLVEAEKLLKHYEQEPFGKTLPPAYIITTYESEEHHLDATDLPSGLLLWGFHHEDLKPGLKTLAEQVEIRRRHAPIFALLESMQKHRRIPATFDGDAEAFLSGSPEKRLQIGQRLNVLGAGGLREGTLASGVVMPTWKAAMCEVCTDDQQRFFVQIPLTDEELLAFAQHPATFFGIIDRNAGRSRAKSALDWFNLLWETYSLTSKEKLIEFMQCSPDIARLKEMTQEGLATEYCTRMANSIMQQEATSESPRQS